MSQNVDLSKPLTQEEYSYLQSRSQSALIERAHSMHNTTDADYDQDYGTGTGPRAVPVNSAERAAQRRAELQAELAALDEQYGDEDADEEPDEDRSYDEWTVKQLDAELSERGLSANGSKAEKVARLEADDAAQ